MLFNIKPRANPHIYDLTKNFENPLSIKGTVSKQNIHLPCSVRLYEKQSGKLIQETPTDHQGNFKFEQLSKMTCFIVAHDPASQFNAVIQDNVVPK